MDTFARLPARDRRFACLKVEEARRLQATSVEKDFWVCWTLRELFALPDIGSALTFKGGTSLSKAWGLIERFSEDIDIVVDKDVLGFAGEASPDQARSRSQRKRRLDALVEACRAWVQSTLQPGLHGAIARRLGTADGWALLVDPNADDGQCLLLHYPSAFPAGEAGYVRPVVKIELGARSDDWPASPRNVVPYVGEVLPQAAPDAIVKVNALAAERTFWEKAMLLHEETFRPLDKPRRERMARHYYDVWCLIMRGIAERAAADAALFQRVAEHRQIFFPITWVDYATLRPGGLRMSPPPHHRDDWHRDYDEMAEPMFYGERPSFDEILRVIGEFEQRFNAAARAST